MKDQPINQPEVRHISTLVARLQARCEKEGRDTFTMEMLREEKRKMYEQPESNPAK